MGSEPDDFETSDLRDENQRLAQATEAMLRRSERALERAEKAEAERDQAQATIAEMRRNMAADVHTIRTLKAQLEGERAALERLHRLADERAKLALEAGAERDELRGALDALALAREQERLESERRRRMLVAATLIWGDMPETEQEQRAAYDRRQEEVACLARVAALEAVLATETEEWEGVARRYARHCMREVARRHGLGEPDDRELIEINDVYDDAFADLRQRAGVTP